jgi:hypothetical protein
LGSVCDESVWRVPKLTSFSTVRKYLAYWIRRPEGWRVAAYRQLPRAPGAVPTAMLPPSLPAFAARPARGLARIEAHRASLHAAEQAFSDRAQSVGLRAAFREYGRPDAMNMGGPGPIAVGLDAVTAGFPEGETISPVSWGTERSFVASSGDLGVSIGIIRGNRPAADGQPPRFPFFTIWRRDRPARPGATSPNRDRQLLAPGPTRVCTDPRLPPIAVTQHTPARAALHHPPAHSPRLLAVDSSRFYLIRRYLTLIRR